MNWLSLQNSLWWLEGTESQLMFRPLWFGRRWLGRYGLIVIKRVPAKGVGSR